MGLMSLFGLGNKKEKIKELLEREAVVLDVRSPAEYKQGHVTPSVNVPLDQLGSKMKQLKKKNKPFITCCASGMRSGAAASKMKQNGIECMNGGSWQSVRKLVETHA